MYKKMLFVTDDPPEQKTKIKPYEKDITVFLSFFDEITKNEINDVLTANKRIPQECISYHDFKKLVLS